MLGLMMLTIQAQQQKPCACCATEFRQFDFWIGQWTVTQPDGKPAGVNQITVIQDSCVVVENWTSAAGSFSGTSYNFYNTKTKKWQQLWLDNQGGNLQLEGQLVNGAMVMQSKELPNQKGQLQIDRITWTPNRDGSVRQLWESSTDKGKTWTVAFDGRYKRQ